MTEEIIRHFKLSTGDELIAKVIDENEYVIFLSEPLMIEEYFSDDGKGRVTLVPYVPYGDQEYFEFLKSHIITSSNVMNEIKRYYQYSIQMTIQSKQQMLYEIKLSNDKLESSILRIQDELLEELYQIPKSSNTIH
jgi:hypothetical protein